MKKIIIPALLALALTACANTWHGAKEDAGYHAERAESGIEHGLDKAAEAVKRGGNAVGRSITNAGERLQNATE
ncbi:lipoprotein [Neisseria chenwenguii]|uniref:lipoprotein n=1 Tax=Neisseria chenwenguii TaxID=1853278 RepID=UPI000F50AB9B|nr:lipoprotein [Neisseria chenwenguii]ROV57174.1 hypothetical protein EGS38_00305 [Neisseria chenwenguii]